MKKLLTFMMIFCLGLFTAQQVFAQEGEAATEETTTEEGVAEEVAEGAEEMADEAEEMAEEAETMVEEAAEEAEEAAEAVVEASGHQVIKEKFIEGGPAFMALPLLCLILGLAIAIERVISLLFASINTDKFVDSIEDALKAGNVEQAKEICRNTRGPVASIFYQGLDRANEGKIDIVEKSVISYGSVQMGQLEKGLVWISLFIALAPMLGFMGTVIGMIQAFDKIETVGDISPSVVASGIKVALLTTVAGLLVAIILQLFYNYLVSKIDSIVNKMEDASIQLVDLLIKYEIVKG